MTVVPTAQLLADARERSTGLPALNVVQLETAEAIVSAAERSGLPVVLQISENCARFHGGLAGIAEGTLAIARASDASIAVHLDHATDVTLIDQALALGFGSVMFDGGTLEFDQNVRVTASVVQRAHERGVLVEAELGEIGGKNGVHAPGVRTDPEEAATFVQQTGVDALAVAVGTSHAMDTRDARLDLDLIARLRDRVSVPLVLHGSSGVSDDNLVEAIRAGMTKINLSTHLNAQFTAEVRHALAENPKLIDPRRYIGPGRDALSAEAERLVRLIWSPTVADTLQ